MVGTVGKRPSSKTIMETLKLSETLALLKTATSGGDDIVQLLKDMEATQKENENILNQLFVAKKKADESKILSDESLELMRKERSALKTEREVFSYETEDSQSELDKRTAEIDKREASLNTSIINFRKNKEDFENNMEIERNKLVTQQGHVARLKTEYADKKEKMDDMFDEFVRIVADINNVIRR